MAETLHLIFSFFVITNIFQIDHGQTDVRGIGRRIVEWSQSERAIPARDHVRDNPTRQQKSEYGGRP